MRNLDIRITLVCDTHPIHVRKVLKVKYISDSMMFEKIDNHYGDDDNDNDNGDQRHPNDVKVLPRSRRT